MSPSREQVPGRSPPPSGSSKSISARRSLRDDAGQGRVVRDGSERGRTDELEGRRQFVHVDVDRPADLLLHDPVAELRCKVTCLQVGRLEHRVDERTERRTDGQPRHRRADAVHCRSGDDNLLLVAAAEGFALRFGFGGIRDWCGGPGFAGTLPVHCRRFASTPGRCSG